MLFGCQKSYSKEADNHPNGFFFPTLPYCPISLIHGKNDREYGTVLLFPLVYLRTKKPLIRTE
jgi:hypothetical protein